MNEDTDHIEDLEKKLYARDPDLVPKRKYGILHPIRQNITSAWGETEIPETKRKRSGNVVGFKRFFLFSLLFFLIAAGIALFSYFRGSVILSSKNVDISILGNSFIGGGEDLPIQVEISNKNAADLIDAELVITYPKGATDQTGADMMRLVHPLGTIPSGKTKSQEFTVILYGEQGLAREIRATLTYKLAGSSALFQKETMFSVMINSSPFALRVDGPAAVGSNQPFTLTVRNVFNGDKPISGALARVEYPHGFVFQSAIPAPVSGNNVWELGDMEKGAERSISIKGKIVGEEQDEKSFRVYVGARESENDNRFAVTYNSTLHTARIAEPFISGTIAVNGQSGDIIAIPSGGVINGVVSWTNNFDSSVTNPEFVLSVLGDSVNLDSIIAENGYINPLNRTITWNAQSISGLGSIEAGQTGQFPFSFETSPASRDGSDIVLGLSVFGTFPSRNNTTAEIKNVDEKTIRFASRLQFAAQSLYSIGLIKNSGPYPAQADKETSYTIVWTIKPSENALQNVSATAVLPQGIVWAGVVVPQGEAVTYNPDTRVVRWNIGTMPRATATPQSKSLSFQVKAKPTKNQIGLDISLLGETTIQATDAVANVPLTITRPALSTRLDTDPAYTPGAERVIP